jgi:hypothetical protein
MTLDKHKTEEENLMDLLDIIILMLMLVEKLEGFQIKNHYNITQIKHQVKKLLSIITPIAERDYAIVFNNGEEETQKIIREYETLVAQIRDFQVPEKVILNQMIHAFNYDKGAIEATVHRILKKKRKT